MPIDEPLAHGHVLPLAGGLKVIHSPGHSAGHLCLLLRQEGLLLAGGICSHMMVLKYSTISEDRPLARRSILRVAEYPFERAAFGHGAALPERANQQLQEAFAAS